MDLDDPATLEAGPTGGLLRDLGSRLVDQMLWLLGPVLSVDAQFDMIELPRGRPTQASSSPCAMRTGFIRIFRRAN